MKNIFLVLVSAALLVTGDEASAAGSNPTYDPKLYHALEYRNIGPYRGGRVTAVAGVVGERDTFYMGTTGGGVWKSMDGGATWRNASDKYFKSASVGAVAVAPSDANVVYVGMGSACVRGNISPGDGVYRSTDAGKSWSHAGLEDAGQIGRVRIHPEDADLVYVAALGHAFGPNEQRGVFRSKDGGGSWEKILYVSAGAGAVDLAMDPNNPRILYAAIWQVVRKPWALVSGGPDSGIYRSSDGGDSWEKLNRGLPQGIKGRIGVAVSGAKSDRVWALVEAEDGGLFRSDDGGATFRLINDDRSFRQRAWYYTHVHADPLDADTLYILNVAMWRSNDGGKSFEFVRTPHSDNHDLWINPDDPKIMINGNDGGANVSYTAGRSWSTQENQPTAEFYRVTVDDGFPYRVYGAQQDNSTVGIESRTTSMGITRQHWHPVGGCESGHIAVDPRNRDIVYAGCYGGAITRYDHRTGQSRQILAWPQAALGQAAEDLEYRFQWNAPIRLSPHDPGVLYHTSQFVHRSTDEGYSWEIISPNLTRDDGAKQGHSGGPITLDNTGVEVYGTVFAFEPSPGRQELLWAGSDDGLVHISYDDGETWKDITPRDMPEWGQVNCIELSAHDPGRAFLAVTRYREDDFMPYIFRTDDYGESWRRLADGVNGIPDNHFVRVVREDPKRKGLLYAGTEFGMYVSFDDGTSWQSLQLNLPVTPITDLAVKGDDLVVATQGRSFWVLDEIAPLRQMDRGVAEAKAFLFHPGEAYRFPGGSPFSFAQNAGRNPPDGVVIHYLLAGAVADEVKLEILDAEGEVLRSLSSLVEERRAPNPFARFMPEDFEEKNKLDTEEGMNRYVWDLRLKDAEIVEGAVLWGRGRGPRVPPGSYAVRLTVGEWSSTRSFTVLKDPRIEASPEELEEQYLLARQVWEGLSESHRALARLRSVRKQVGELVRRLEETGVDAGVKEASAALSGKLTAVEERLHQSRAVAIQDIINFPPKLDAQFLYLLDYIDGADAPPTAGAIERYVELRAELDGILAELGEIFRTDLAKLNDLILEREIPPVIVK
jgi:photosystem II stability/assembly factor-like uncharacterized protein